MTFKHKLSKRLARLRVPAFLLVALAFGCELVRNPVTDPSTPEISQLLILPATAVVPTDQTTDFAVVGLAATGDTVATSLSWSVTSGAITGTSSNGGKKIGHYRAPKWAGQDRVIVQDTSGTADTAFVTVTTIPVAWVEVTPASVTVDVGKSVQLSAVAKDSAGGILPDRVMTWSSTNPLIAVVGLTGLVTGVSAGTAGVIGTSEGRSDTASIVVVVPPPPVDSLGASLPPPLALSTGQAFYVATTGSDANPGSLAQPWKTIQKAMSALQPGQVAFVRAGVYETGGTFGTSDDSQYWSANCTALAPCSIVAYPGERPVIHGWIKITGSYLRLSGFIIEGPLSRDETSCSERRAMQIEISGAHHLEISHNEIRNNDYHAGIYLTGVNNVHVLSNYIHDNGRFRITDDPCTGSSVWNVDHGIYWARTSGGGNLVANNLFVHNRGYGIQFYPSATDVLVIQNTFVENGNSGVLTYESADRITVINNVSAFNERNKQIRLVSGNANEVRRNVVYSPTSSWNGIENGTSSTVADNVVADPGFVDRARRDFRVLAGSPAVDWALFRFSALRDYLLQSRPLGAAPDVGAFER